MYISPTVHRSHFEQQDKEKTPTNVLLFHSCQVILYSFCCFTALTNVCVQHESGIYAPGPYTGFPIPTERIIYSGQSHYLILTGEKLLITTLQKVTLSSNKLNILHQAGGLELLWQSYFLFVQCVSLFCDEFFKRNLHLLQ